MMRYYSFVRRKILKDSISKLNEKEIESFTGKSVSHFRKCSDPDDLDHNLHLSDAIKIDILLLKSQNRSPFLDNISLMIEILLFYTPHYLIMNKSLFLEQQNI